MKKVVFLLFALLSATMMFAAEEVAKEQTSDNILPTYLWRDGGKFYQGETLLDKVAYQNLLRNTCPEAFKQYQKGRRLMTAGWSVFGVGAGVFALGTGLIVANIVILENDPSTDEIITSPLGLAFGLGICYPIAGGLMLTSVPILAVGYTERNKSVDTYNLHHAPEPAVTYHITAGQNGIGFAINF